MMKEFNIRKMEIDNIMRATGKDNVHPLAYDDLSTTDIDVSLGIEHA